MNNIGKLLVAYRQKHDVTLRQLAAELEVSASTVSRLETGKQIDSENCIKVINWLFKVDNENPKVDKHLYQGTGLAPGQSQETNEQRIS